MIILAWCVVGFFALALLVGILWIITGGFSDWWSALVGFAIVLCVSVAFISLAWAANVIKTHNQPQKAEATP